MFPAGDLRFSTTFLPLSISAGPLVIRAIECGDRGSERIVFCVHGWACSVYSYRRLMPLLADRGMRVVAIDLAGHGLSEKPDDVRFYSLDAQVETVFAAMQALGIERCVLAGHSMGGPICARAAVLAPDRVSGLALLAPAGFGTEWDLRILRALTPRALTPLLPHIVGRWMVALVFRAVYGTIYRPTRRDIDEYWAPSQLHGFFRAMWDLLHRFDWDAGLDCGFGHISAPTTIIDGKRDNLVIRRWVRRYAEVVPAATLRIVEDCGHVVPEEVPDLVATAIERLTG
jgi:pimeloyl-ACP methyl ester carboxylesterase